MLSDGYVKYVETEVYRLAIMQDFRDIGLSLCDTLHFVLYSWSSYFFIFFLVK